MSEHTRKTRRPRGSGSVYRKGRVWWISYYAPDGRRHAESSESTRKGDAERLLRRRIGAREHNLPVIPRAEKLTFIEAAQAMLDDFAVNAKRSLSAVRGRIGNHLLPYFGARRLVGITRDDVTAYVAHRQAEGIVAVKGERRGQRIGDVSNGEINRELQHLKRIFNLAIEGGRIATAPKVRMLKEAPPRSGFFEREQFEAVLRHLPPEIGPVVTFAYITGWRIASEVLPLEWRRVDFQAGEIRLDPGTTKNDDGRTFPMTKALRALLETQHAEHLRLKRAGQIVPWVFVRMSAKGRGGEQHAKPIRTFGKAWQTACVAAGCPGRIPHDFRRTAVRNLVRAGVPERVAMKLTGHKTRSVFDRYDITSPGDLREAAARLDAMATGTRDDRTGTARTSGR